VRSSSRPRAVAAPEAYLEGLEPRWGGRPGEAQEFVARFPHDSVIAGHPSAMAIEDDDRFERSRRIAWTVVRLIGVGAAIAAVLLYLVTIGRRAQPSAERAPAVAAAPEPTPPVTAPPSVERPAPPLVSDAPARTQTADVSSKPPPAGEGLLINVSARRPCWVSATVDGKKAIEQLLQVGDERTVDVRREMVLTAGDAAFLCAGVGKDGAAPTLEFIEMNLLVLAGDGIGPEITAATLSVLRAASERFRLGLRIEEAPVGHAGLRALGSTIHADIVEKARKADGVVLGPTSTFEFKDPARGEINPSMMLRKSLDLFANIRPARTYRGFQLHCGAFDLVVARENTEGFYADRNMEAGSGEMLVTKDVAV